MEIRRARVEDIPRLNDLLGQVLRIHHEARPDIFKGGVTKYTPEELSVLLKDPMRPVLVAEEGGMVLGYCFTVIIRHENDNILADIKTLYIDDLCVDESCRGRGVGKALYSAALELAGELRCYNVTLNVWECNGDALAFYRRMGLVPQKTVMEKIIES